LQFFENTDYRRQPFIDEAIRLVFALSKQAIEKGNDAELTLRQTLARLQAAKVRAKCAYIFVDTSFCRILKNIQTKFTKNWHTRTRTRRIM
jgi:hypothetical protein